MIKIDFTITPIMDERIGSWRILIGVMEKWAPGFPQIQFVEDSEGFSNDFNHHSKCHWIDWKNEEPELGGKIGRAKIPPEVLAKSKEMIQRLKKVMSFG